jgi:hypothetical protein
VGEARTAHVGGEERLTRLLHLLEEHLMAIPIFIPLSDGDPDVSGRAELTALAASAMTLVGFLLWSMLWLRVGPYYPGAPMQGDWQRAVWDLLPMYMGGAVVILVSVVLLIWCLVSYARTARSFWVKVGLVVVLAVPASVLGFLVQLVIAVVTYSPFTM